MQAAQTSPCNTTSPKNRCTTVVDLMRPIYQSDCPYCGKANVSLDDLRHVTCDSCGVDYSSPGFVFRQIGNSIKGLALILIASGWLFILAMSVWMCVRWFVD